METIAFRTSTGTRMLIEAAAIESEKSPSEWLRENARKEALEQLKEREEQPAP
jgi:uncharacterized protein (DUF1778 family)